MLDVPQAKLLEAQAMDSSSCSRQDLAMGRSKENGCGVDVWLKNAKIKTRLQDAKGIFSPSFFDQVSYASPLQAKHPSSFRWCQNKLIH